MPITPGKLADQIGATLINGEPSTEVSSVAVLQHTSPGDISFLANRGYRKYLVSARAGVVILAPDGVAVCPVTAIVTDHPCVAYARAARLLFPMPASCLFGVHTAIAGSVGISVSALTGIHCMIGGGAGSSDILKSPIMW